MRLADLPDRVDIDCATILKGCTAETAVNCTIASTADCETDFEESRFV